MSAGASGRLFRAAPLPAPLDVFDVHVNALPDGMAPPGGLYGTVGAGEVLDGRDDDSPGLHFGGGCMTPPAGTDLLEGSRRLARRVAERGGGWHALLRFDAGGGARPATSPASALRGVGRSLRRSPDGAVERALLDEPELLDGFAGVKLTPQASALPGAEALRLLGARRTPVLVHAGILCPPRWLERHLLPHLEGALILAHLGSWPCSADDLERAVELARDDERVYLETSGASIGNFVRHAAERVPEKLLFGSNRPMCPPAVQFAHVAASVHDDDVLRAVAAGNARRLFGLPPDGASPDGASRCAPERDA